MMWGGDVTSIGIIL